MAIEDAVQNKAAGRRFASTRDIEEFVSTLEAFERGEITVNDFKAYRLGRGVYGQRQENVQMLRVKIPQGVLNGDQLRTLATVARDYSRGIGHVTDSSHVRRGISKASAVRLATRSRPRLRRDGTF